MCCPPGVRFAVYEPPENQLGVELAGFDQLLPQIAVDRHIQPINNAWQQYQRPDAVPTGMPGSLEIINANSRTAHLQG